MDIPVNSGIRLQWHQAASRRVHHDALAWRLVRHIGTAGHIRVLVLLVAYMLVALGSSWSSQSDNSSQPLYADPSASPQLVEHVSPLISTTSPLEKFLVRAIGTRAGIQALSSLITRPGSALPPTVEARPARSMSVASSASATSAIGAAVMATDGGTSGDSATANRGAEAAATRGAPAFLQPVTAANVAVGGALPTTTAAVLVTSAPVSAAGRAPAAPVRTTSSLGPVAATSPGAADAPASSGTGATPPAARTIPSNPAASAGSSAGTSRAAASNVGLASAGDESLENLVRSEFDTVMPGKFALTLPLKMEVGKKNLIVARVAENLATNVADGLERKGLRVATVAQLRFRMQAYVSGDGFRLNIGSDAAEEQALDAHTANTWNWEILPTSAGTDKILLVALTLVDRHNGVDIAPVYTQQYFVSVAPNNWNAFRLWWDDQSQTILLYVGLAAAVVLSGVAIHSRRRLARVFH